jgi:hypothetical protein
MQLPPLPFELPVIALPFSLPAGLSTPLEHFVVTLPVVVLTIEIINVLFRRGSIVLLSFLFICFAVVLQLMMAMNGKGTPLDLLTSYIVLFGVLVLLLKLFTLTSTRSLLIQILFLVCVIFWVWLVLEKSLV